MEVGEMGDAKAVELVRDPFELDLDDAPPQPPCLEPPPGEGAEHQRAKYPGEPDGR